MAEMELGQIAGKLMDAGIDTVGTERAIILDGVDEFLDDMENEDDYWLSGLDIEALREKAQARWGGADFSRICAAGPVEAWSKILSSPNTGIPLETLLERVRTTLAAHIGETLTAYTAGIIEIEIIQDIAVPKGERKPNG